MGKKQLGILSVLVLSVVIGGVALQASPNNPPAVGVSTPAALELSAQDVWRIVPQTLRQQLPLAGSLDPLQQTILTAPVAGVVDRVAVREGEAVAAGQLLAHFSAQELALKTQELAQQVQSSQAQLRFAEKDHALQEKLFRQQFVSQQAFDRASSTRDSQQAQLKAAEAQLATAQEYLQRTWVRAPFAGVVTEKMVQAGQRVGTESQLFRLVNPRVLELVAPVPAANIVAVKIGQTATLQAEGVSHAVTARVVRINAQANSGSRHINVYLQVDNPQGQLRAGVFAQGQLALGTLEQALAVPVAALWQEQGKTWLRVVRQGKALPVTVQTAARDEARGLVQIIGGVHEGEVVIATPMNLAAGAPVRIQGH